MTPRRAIDTGFLLILIVSIGGIGAMVGSILVYYVFPFLNR